MNVRVLTTPRRTLALALTGLVLAALSPPTAANPEPYSQASKQHSPAQRLNQQVHRALERARMGQAQAAMASLQAVLDEQPEHHDARLLLATMQAARGDLQQAQTTLEQGLATAPHHANLRMNLARVQMQAGQATQALETLETGVTTQPTADYRALYAVVLHAEGFPLRATIQYALAIREQPYNAQWLVGIAVSLHALGQVEAAREAFERARNAPDFNRRLADGVAQYGVIP